VDPDAESREITEADNRETADDAVETKRAE